MGIKTPNSKLADHEHTLPEMAKKGMVKPMQPNMTMPHMPKAGAQMPDMQKSQGRK